MPGAAGTMPGAAGIGTVGGPPGVPTVIVPGPDQGPARMGLTPDIGRGSIVLGIRPSRGISPSYSHDSTDLFRRPTVTDGRESRARSCLGGTLFYENSDRSEYTAEG